MLAHNKAKYMDGDGGGKVHILEKDIAQNIIRQGYTNGLIYEPVNNTIPKAW
jgi:hypothetical protein